MVNDINTIMSRPSFPLMIEEKVGFRGSAPKTDQ